MLLKELLPVAGFVVVNACGQVLLKYSSDSPRLWLLLYMGGGFLIMGSFLFLIAAYRLMNPNVAMALGGGAGFLLTQILFLICFRQSLSVPQYVAIALIFAGIVLFGMNHGLGQVQLDADAKSKVSLEPKK